MRSHLNRVCFASVTIVLLFTLLRSGLALPPNGGSFQLTIQASSGSGTVSGKLENVIIQPNNTISMIMVADQMQISAHGAGSLGISGLHKSNFTGTLNGMRNGSILSGQIQNLAGKACISACFDLVFVGEGQWSGTISQTYANGTLQGTITITYSPIPQIPTGRALPFSGTWSASATQVSENAEFTLPVCLMLVGVAFIVVKGGRRDRASKRTANSNQRK